MRHGKRSFRIALITAMLAAFTALTGPSASAAAAEQPSPGQAAAGVLCGPLGPLLDESQAAACVAVVSQAWTTVDGIGAAAVCAVVLPGVAKVGVPVCVKVVEPLLGDAVAAAKAAASAAVTAAKFIANPADGFESLANHVKEGAASLVETVMVKAATAVSPMQLNSDWFRGYYAPAFGLGLVVLAVMLFMLYKDVGRGELEESDLASAIVHAPLVVLVMAFTPAVGSVLAGFADALAAATAKLAAPAISDFLVTDGSAWAAMSAVTAGVMPGGVLVPIVVFLCMMFGAFSTLMGIIAQSIGVYVSTVTLAIGWGMWVHPKWRPKVRKLLAFVISLMLQKAALWLVLGAIFTVLTNAFGPPSVTDGFSLLVALIGTATGLVMVGLAPWALLKYMPLMPGGNEHRQASGGHVTEAALGGVAGGVSSVMMQRAYSMSRNTSSSTSGGGGGAVDGSGGAASPGGGSAGGGWRSRGVSQPAPAASGAGGPGATAAAGAKTAGVAAGGGTGGAASAGMAARAGSSAAAGPAAPLVIGAQAGVAAATSLVGKARRVAEDAAPTMGGDDA